MSTSARMIEQKVLSEAFQEAVKGWRVRAAVFLTFRFDPGFFEQEILPVFFDIPLSHAPMARVLHLADILRVTGPVAVYYDRRALEAGAASARTDFQRIGIVHRTGYFHPKNVLLLVDRNEAIVEPGTAGNADSRALIVASLSANLTRAGWWENVEVAHIETVPNEGTCAFRDDLLDLIALLRRVSPQGADQAALDEIHAFVRKLGQDSQRVSGGLLVPRLFTGDRDLVEFLAELAENRLKGRCLEVISPYFDDKESSRPLLRLIERLRPRETRVFLPKGPLGEALCSAEYWQAVRDKDVAWAKLPTEVVRLSRDTERFVHAKVYRFFDPDDRRETLFVGSVNLTNAGFSQGGNVESGFVVETEARRKGEWWLEPDEKRPGAFAQKGESDALTDGPGTNLVVRYNWTSGTATALWGADADSPPLLLRGAGVTLGEVTSLQPGQLTPLAAELAIRLKEHLTSSSFVTVSVEGHPDAVVLVDEEGAVDKPSLLTTISPDEILRYWSLLSDEQRQEFIEHHAGELGDDELAMWMGAAAVLPAEDGMFGTFAHVYLSFGNLERAVRKALAEKRHKEAVDRLFGQKFDSLRSLVKRVVGKEEPNPVRDYVTLLCALQVLDVLRKEEPDFHARERTRFDLRAEVVAALQPLKDRLTFANAEERQKFFGWFERWFVLRATPPPPADLRP